MVVVVEEQKWVSNTQAEDGSRSLLINVTIKRPATHSFWPSNSIIILLLEWWWATWNGTLSPPAPSSFLISQMVSVREWNECPSSLTQQQRSFCPRKRECRERKWLPNGFISPQWAIGLLAVWSFATVLWWWRSSKRRRRMKRWSLGCSFFSLTHSLTCHQMIITSWASCNHLLSNNCPFRALCLIDFCSICTNYLSSWGGDFK